MQDEVAQLCEQLGIAKIAWSDCGSQVLHLGESRKSSCDNCVLDTKEAAQGTAQAAVCMKKVRKIPCWTMGVSMADDIVG